MSFFLGPPPPSPQNRNDGESWGSDNLQTVLNKRTITVIYAVIYETNLCFNRKLKYTPNNLNFTFNLPCFV